MDVRRKLVPSMGSDSGAMDPSLKVGTGDDSAPYPGEVEEAKRYPNGYVYRIAGHYGPNDEVPATAIVGCWRVDADGQIVGTFVKNPNYDPKK